MKVNQVLELSMLRHVKEWPHSGLSQIVYCLEQGISFGKFNYWVRKARPSAAGPSGFVSIQVENSVLRQLSH